MSDQTLHRKSEQESNQSTTSKGAYVYKRCDKCGIYLTDLENHDCLNPMYHQISYSVSVNPLADAMRMLSASVDELADELRKLKGVLETIKTEHDTMEPQP